MRKFAFISRHAPNDQQKYLALQQDIELIHVGDRDGFNVSIDEFKEYNGAVVVHPAAALRLLAKGFDIGVFNNTNRAAVGEPPKFETTAFHIYKYDC
jgi:hypothetical protein